MSVLNTRKPLTWPSPDRDFYRARRKGTWEKYRLAVTLRPQAVRTCQCLAYKVRSHWFRVSLVSIVVILSWFHGKQKMLLSNQCESNGYSDPRHPLPLASISSLLIQHNVRESASRQQEISCLGAGAGTQLYVTHAVTARVLIATIYHVALVAVGPQDSTLHWSPFQLRIIPKFPHSNVPSRAFTQAPNNLSQSARACERTLTTQPAHRYSFLTSSFVLLPQDAGAKWEALHLHF